MVIPYTDDGFQELGPKRMDFFEFGSCRKIINGYVVGFWNCHNQISSKI